MKDKKETKDKVVMENALTFEYPIATVENGKPKGEIVRGFIKPSKDQVIVKSIGYAFESHLNQHEDRAILWRVNEVIAVGDTVNVADRELSEESIVKPGRFILFEDKARHINSDNFNEDAVFNILTKIRTNEPLYYIKDAGYSSKDSATRLIKEIDEDDKKTGRLVTKGNNIVKLVEYYFVKAYQVIAIVSEEPFVEEQIKNLLNFKYESLKPNRPAIGR